MTTIMPQELDVWYVLPAIRRELAKIFIDKHDLSQKEVANILGITEATISHYLHAKRGNELKFSEDEKALIATKAKVILDHKDEVMKHVFELCEKLRTTKAVCDFHKKHDKEVPSDCKLCMD